MNSHLIKAWHLIPGSTLDQNNFTEQMECSGHKTSDGNLRLRLSTISSLVVPLLLHAMISSDWELLLGLTRASTASQDRCLAHQEQNRLMFARNDSQFSGFLCPRIYVQFYVSLVLKFTCTRNTDAITVEIYDDPTGAIKEQNPEMDVELNESFCVVYRQTDRQNDSSSS